MYNPETVEDFISSWESLLDQYSLRENTWMKGMYKLHEKWAQVYGRSHFCAGIKSLTLKLFIYLFFLLKQEEFHANSYLICFQV